MRRSRVVLALLLVAGGALHAEGPPLPAVELRERTLVVSSLPAVLARPEVKPHLSTGLTTTLLVEVDAADPAGHKARGGGKVDVRYEPWDEVFLVVALGIDGRPHKESLASFERLVAWWRGLALPVLTAEALAPLGAGAPWQVRVRVSVIPFSQSEQREAQRWLTESIESPAPSADNGRGEALSGALDLLLATSIKRQRLVSYDWTIVVPPERRR